MSDILTRLLLNTGDYDSKLGRAKKSSEDFAANIGGKVAGMVGKFAAGIGIAMGGVEAFNKVMDSTQATGDLMRGTMQSLKTSVDEFFYSVNRGNLSSFLSNLDSMISKAREAYDAMDQLGNTQMSFGVLSARNQAQIAEAQYLAKNKFAPTSERIGAFGQIAEAIRSEEGNVRALQRELVNTVTKTVKSRINANIEVTLEDVIKAFETDLLAPNSRTDIKDRAERGMRNYEINAKRSDWTQEQKDELAELQKQNIITYTMLGKFNDEQLQQIGQQIQQYYSLINAVRNLGREYNEAANEFNNANKGVTGFTPIKALTGYDVYSGTSEASKNFIGGGGTTGASIPKKEAGLEATLFVDTNFNYDTPLGEKVLKAMQGDGTLPIIHQEVVIDEEVDEDPIPGITEEKKDIDKMNESLRATSDIFGSLGSIAGTAGEDFLAASIGMMGNISNMILQLQALTTAQGVSSASKLPFPANLAAIATVVATIASVFASLPKFAEGGIIGGSSYFGDKLLARVNSGEMILNQRQQGRLLSLTSGSNVRVSGDVRLNGKDIYISLRNYMSSSGNRL